MRVKDVIKFLQKFPPDTVVRSGGVDYTGNVPRDGELNVAESRKGVPYLCHYEIGISYDGGKTTKVRRS